MIRDDKQLRHEAPDLGGAIEGMMRALVRRAGEGEYEAIAQLQRVAQLAPVGLRLGVRAAHEDGMSWTLIGSALNSSRQNAQQLAAAAAPQQLGAGHVLVPGHNRRTCPSCRRCSHGRTEASRRDNPCPAGLDGCDTPEQPAELQPAELQAVGSDQ